MSNVAASLPRLAACLLLWACGGGGGHLETVPAVAPPSSRTLEVRNGRWFDGNRFVPRTLYVADGRFQRDRPATIDSVLDLAGGYVIPPFGDAHTHNLDGMFNLERVRDGYLAEGTFYVQVLTNSASRTATVRSRFNRPCDLDVAYANGGLTSTLSHPFLAYEPRAMNLQGDWGPHAAAIRKSRIREGDAYWFIDNAEDLEAKWPRILEARPDVIKIFLLDAREVPPPMADSGLPHGQGLRPSLVPLIVDRAHRAGLRVAAHVETAADFATAVHAGVDMLAHLPGYGMGADDDGRARAGAPTAPFEITDGMAREAGKRHVAITPTVSWTYGGGGPDSLAAFTARQELMRRNVARLRQAGARFIVGSDWFGATATKEISAIRALGAWTDSDVLRMWIETPTAIFPTRRIGRLEPGYEASFLVLRDDPLARFDAVRDIALRVKQGCVVP